MNRKRILVFTLALLVVGSASITTYAASKSTSVLNKNVVVTVDSKDGNTNVVTKDNISDEEAVKMATKAMKDYLGLDANYFGEAHVTRTNAKDDFEFFKDIYPQKDAEVLAENSKKSTANVIDVQFIPASDLKQPGPARDLVVIDEENGEIVSITGMSNIDQNFKAEIDDTKVKESILNFFSKVGKNIQSNTIKVSKTANSGVIRILCNLEDGRDAKMMINLKDYSVMNYEVNYDNLITLPSVQKDHEENFRDLQIKQ
ncbi:hypothetical protein I6U48_00735 [Clostridium sp. PL3]|uniref:Uncharacterized protein n=1 Tax=Clostridium thailandense TaxID=2794346 RepID=A0A949WPL1_9CLOT|nr:hypothetical protein [Clostridium thailandense]MBV7271446.1 hypothetical protein [Clostridium thailandense]